MACFLIKQGHKYGLNYNQDRVHLSNPCNKAFIAHKISLKPLPWTRQRKPYHELLVLSLLLNSGDGFLLELVVFFPEFLNPSQDLLWDEWYDRSPSTYFHALTEDKRAYSCVFGLFYKMGAICVHPCCMAGEGGGGCGGCFQIKPYMKKLTCYMCHIFSVFVPEHLLHLLFPILSAIFAVLL